MRPSHHLASFTVRVPGPFAGVDELGFSARYPDQAFLEPPRDVPLWIEGPAPPMRRLKHRLQMLVESSDRPYAWTDPVRLADEVVILGFHDRSWSPGLAQTAAAFSDYFANLVRPVVFPFLEDCARVADLRLADPIELLVEAEDWPVARFVLRLSQIVPANGFDLLGESA
jgi:hypothetical protein